MSAVLDEPLTAGAALARVRLAYAELDADCPAARVDECVWCDRRDRVAARAELALLDAGGTYDDLVALWPEELQGWAEGRRPRAGWRTTAGDGSTTASRGVYALAGVAVVPPPVVPLQPGVGGRLAVAGDGSYTGRILEVLAEGPRSLADLADLVGRGKQWGAATLGRLVGQGRVRRVSQGVYALVTP